MRFNKKFVCVLAFSIVGMSGLVGEEINRLTPTETYVLQKLKSGQDADLGTRSAVDRVLRPKFVEKLITGGYPYPEIKRGGVRIINAILKDRLVVSGTDVPFRVWFEHCTFEHGIDFGYTKFARDLSLEGSQFGTSISLTQPISEQDGI